MTEKGLLRIIDKAAREGRTKLELVGKGIKSLPAEIGKLTKLTELNLGFNRLSELPAEIGKLTKLTELSLWNNKVSSRPAEIWKLTSLTKLDVRSNGLSSLPAEIGKLTNLTTLDLSNNKLRSLPAEIGKLTSLRRLYVEGNRLRELPVEIGKLTKLTGLYLAGNQLSTLPAEIGKLTNLMSLDLLFNKVGELPAEIWKLTKLMELYLVGNELRSLPVEIGKLTNLTALYLDGNKLRELPAEIGKLTKLTALSLMGNQVGSVPVEIGQLKNVTRLRLSNNWLSSLPSELGELRKLRVLDLEPNPLESPPAEVVEQGRQAVLAYLRELAKGKRKRYEAKLLILGDADEGKTCVSRALRGEQFEHQVTTEGVDIEPWTFEHPDEPKARSKRITLKIWDFEGQEINHQSHQFFLTQRALYLVVFKGREVFKQNRVEYWLDTIRSRAPESEVMLVATECGRRTPHVPVDELRAKYPDLLKHKKCYFEVECEKGKGVKALQRHIQGRAAKLEVMGAGWPVSYARAEKEIRRRSEKKAHISRRSLNGIFKRSGIERGDYEIAARQMGYLGIITHFPDSAELKDFIVLKPQWLTKAISYVLENKQLEKEQGEITHARLHELWEGQYPGVAETFHKCMREFELCYDLEYRRRHLSLMPLRFGYAEPKKIPWSKVPRVKERRIEYRFEVTPPAGIMSRFIVKTHYMIVKTREMQKGVYWYNGVFLGVGDGASRSEALCEFDEDKRVMSIRVRAAFPQNMVEQLNGFVQSVFSFFEGLKAERYYGCVKVRDRKEAQCKGIYTEKRISFALTEREKLSCEYEYHKVDPLNLVTGISSFGEWAGLEDKLRVILRREMDKEPEWAEKFGKYVRAVLARIDDLGVCVEEIKVRTKQLPAEIGQRVDLALRDYLGLLNEMLDNRDFNSAPAVVSIVPVGRSKFNPKNWFEKEYLLTPYCEWEGGVHKVDCAVKFKKSRKWWEKTAPKLALGVKVLSAGLRIGFAGLPVGVDAKLFDAMKNEVAFMKELAGHLKLEGGAESDISGEAGELVEEMKGRGAARDLRQKGGGDEKRIARMQLAELLGEIAPRNYKARQWGPLRRVRMPDETYRWLCDKHAEMRGR